MTQAQTLPNRLRRAQAAGSVPPAGEFDLNDLVISQFDGVLYWRDSAGTVHGLDLLSRLLAPLASPALTGAPTAPTPAATDSTGRLATTAFVNALLANCARLDVVTGATAAQQAIGRLNLGAASNDDLRALGRYLTKLTGTSIQTGSRVIEEFTDATGLDTANSANANVVNGTLVNQAQEPNTKVLLHFDKPNGSTVITDEVGHTFSAQGNAKISTAQSKFGGSALQIIGGSDAAVCAAAADLSVGTGDYAHEIYGYIANTSASGMIFQIGNSSNYVSIYITGSNQNPNVYVNGSLVIQGAIQLSSNTMYHFAVSKASGVLRLFVNGNVVGSYSGSNDSITPAGTAAIVIGNGFAGNSPCAGFFDEYRMSNSARYTAAFTPPTAPFVYGTSGALDAKSIVFPVPPGVTVNRASFYSAMKAVSGGPIDLTPGTGNVVARATRGGGQYATFPLQKLITLGGWDFVKADGLDLSGLPAGASPAYEITCPASLGLAVDTVEFEYGN